MRTLCGLSGQGKEHAECRGPAQSPQSPSCSLLDPEPLLALREWGDEGLGGSGSRVIFMHTYTSTSIQYQTQLFTLKLDNLIFVILAELKPLHPGFTFPLAVCLQGFSLIFLSTQWKTPHRHKPPWLTELPTSS